MHKSEKKVSPLLIEHSAERAQRVVPIVYFLNKVSRERATVRLVHFKRVLKFEASFFDS